MKITKVKKIKYQNPGKVLRGEAEYYQDPYSFATDNDNVSFSIFQAKDRFYNLKTLTPPDVFDQLVDEGAFHCYFDDVWKMTTCIGFTEKELMYCISDGYLIVLSTTEKQPGVYWTYIEGIWEILEMEE